MTSAVMTAPAAPSRGAAVRQLWILMATVFVDMAGAMIVLPLLPFYALRMHAPPAFVGVLVSTFFLAQIVVSPLWGRMSDRYGRRPMILAGLFLSVVAYTLFGLATTLTMLLLTRLVQGAGSGTVGVVQAYVSDSIAPEERAKALGWVSAATSAGVSIGALIGGAATYLGRSAPGYLAAGLCLLNLLSAWRWLPESKRRDVAAGSGGGVVPSGTASAVGAAPRVSVWLRMWQVVREPGSPVGSLIWIYGLGMMIFMAMNSVLGLYLQRAYGVTEHTINLFYGFVGVISVVMRAVLLGPAIRRLGEVGAMRLGTLALALGMGAIPLPVWLGGPYAMRVACFALIITLVPVGTALLFPSTTAMVTRRCPREETGQIMGVQQLFGGIARMVGPLWAAWLFGKYVNFPFWVAAVLMLGGGFLTWRVRPEPRQSAVVDGNVIPAAATVPSVAAAAAVDVQVAAAGNQAEPAPAVPAVPAVGAATRR